jgi:hypothetical protein
MLPSSDDRDNDLSLSGNFCKTRTEIMINQPHFSWDYLIMQTSLSLPQFFLCLNLKLMTTPEMGWSSYSDSSHGVPKCLISLLSLPFTTTFAFIRSFGASDPWHVRIPRVRPLACNSGYNFELWEVNVFISLWKFSILWYFFLFKFLLILDFFIWKFSF